jgi:hypothetical protein
MRYRVFICTKIRKMSNYMKSGKKYSSIGTRDLIENRVGNF